MAAEPTRISRFLEALNEQEWFQQLKAKWEELDPQHRFYAKTGSLGGVALLVLIVAASSILSVRGLKSELEQKNDLLTLIQSASDELRRLKETNATVAGKAGDKSPWAGYFQASADAAGIPKESIEISSERPAGKGDQFKESLFDVSLKHVSIRQVVRYSYGIENGARPVKLRSLTVDTKADPEGYLDARLAVSAFVATGK